MTSRIGQKKQNQSQSRSQRSVGIVNLKYRIMNTVMTSHMGQDFFIVGTPQHVSGRARGANLSTWRRVVHIRWFLRSGSAR